MAAALEKSIASEIGVVGTVTCPDTLTSDNNACTFELVELGEPVVVRVLDGEGDAVSWVLEGVVSGRGLAALLVEDARTRGVEGLAGIDCPVALVRDVKGARARCKLHFEAGHEVAVEAVKACAGERCTWSYSKASEKK